METQTRLSRHNKFISGENPHQLSLDTDCIFYIYIYIYMVKEVSMPYYLPL